MNIQEIVVSGVYRPRVLVAEDDDATRRILLHLLEHWGYDVLLASDGFEAWEILQRERSPELVILDWEMPGMDGIELCRRLRDKSREYYHYVLMITGRDAKQDIVHARESGADDCLGKPFDEADLRARLGVACRIVGLQNELIRSRERHREDAMKDGMTGLWNRTAFFDLMERELTRAARTNGRTGLLLLDLDRFKSINDAYGHLVGDIVLKETARRLKQAVRSYDFVGRYGGEEFLIALPGCDGKQLRKRAEAIRQAVANGPVRVGGTDLPITVSVGAVVATARLRSFSDILAAADAALYKAKNAGRNCIVFNDRPVNETAIDSNGTQVWLGWGSDVHDALTLPDGRRLSI